MTNHPLADPRIRDSILSEPGPILEDAELMRALVAAADGRRGANVIDMRALAMDRLEARLDRLEDTHRTVVAAAYENLAGTNMIHRAILSLLEPCTPEEFLAALTGPVAAALRVDTVNVILETEGEPPAIAAPPEVIGFAEPGYVSLYVATGRGGAPRRVTLRRVRGSAAIHGPGGPVQSEACLTLDLGPGRLPGVLVLGAADPQQFAPGQGTDLLAFFGSVFERALRRLL